MFTITDNMAIYHEFIPCKVEALVSQETQCELQTGEQEEIAEINQAQHLKLLHSCKHVQMGQSVHVSGSQNIRGSDVQCAYFLLKVGLLPW